MSSLLDTKETKAANAVSPSYQANSYKSCLPEWKAARAVYHILEDLGEIKKLDAFDYCRKVAWFVRHEESGKVRVASQQCHLRWCPLCANTRTGWISSQVVDWTEKTKFSKFLTLTIKSSDEPIAAQINKLYDSFKRLRKLKDFKSKIKAGVWFFQITFNKRTQQWHPHLHMIAIGKFLSKRVLSQLWLRCTGDSPIVDIKAIKDKAKAASYCARYAAKPALLSELPTESACELVLALHGRRINGKWGKGCKVSFRPQKPDDAAKWTNIGDFSFIVYLHEFDDAAGQIVKAWKDQTELAAGVSLIVRDDEPTDYDFQDPLELPENVPVQTYLDFF